VRFIERRLKKTKNLSSSSEISMTEGDKMVTRNLTQIVFVACFSVSVPLLVACENDNTNTVDNSMSAAGLGFGGSAGVGALNGSAGSAGSAGGAGSVTSPGGAGTDAAPLDYSNDALWMCKPGAANNPCETEVAATEILKDNSHSQPIAHTIKQDAAFDCFYVYPTVDLTAEAGNHMDLTDNAAPRATATIQAARFSSVCRVYAPYYRQMKIGTYTSAEFQKHFEFAYNDVLKAFDYYLMNYNSGRKLVLMGHSQGSHILTRLVSEKFDNVPEMRDKLISALLVGTSDIFVPKGQKVGGTFINIPLCSKNTETGCVVAYNCVSAPSSALFIGVRQPTAEQEVACVNPGALAGGKADLITYVSATTQPSLAGLATSFALFRNFFTGECIAGTIPALVIQTNPPSDAEKRVNPYDFAATAAIMTGSNYSLHTIDYDLTQGNLVELVKAQGEAKQ
jgi:hypothetical protein